MGKLVEIAKSGELKNGEIKAANIAGHNILLAKVGDNYYAADSRCPHLGGNLAKGNLEGTVVTCPLHGSQFDLADGRVIRWTNFTGLTSKVGNLFKPPRPLVTYKVKVEGDKVLVEV